MESHALSMSQSIIWTCCTIFVNILTSIKDLVNAMLDFQFNVKKVLKQFFEPNLLRQRNFQFFQNGRLSFFDNTN
jgi:hypothetical protein